MNRVRELVRLLHRAWGWKVIRNRLVPTICPTCGRVVEMDEIKGMLCLDCRAWKALEPHIAYYRKVYLRFRRYQRSPRPYIAEKPGIELFKIRNRMLKVLNGLFSGTTYQQRAMNILERAVKKAIDEPVEVAS